MGESAVITSVSTQVSVIFLLILSGYVLSKLNIITKQGCSELSGILLTIVTPCVLLRAHHVDFDYSAIKMLLVAYAFSIFIHVVYIIICEFAFGFSKDKDKSVINKTSAIYSNCGFMGIPLLEACFGSEGTFFGSAYLAVFNVLAWTHCRYVISKNTDKQKESALKKILLNPGVIGVLLGLIIYFTQIKFPTPIKNTVWFIAELNTPLAMFVLGNLLSRADIKSTLKNKSIYSVALFRLITAPIIFILILKLFGLGNVMAYAIVISSACPTAAIIAIFAERYGKDALYASNIAVVTTLCSLITIPFICYLSTLIL